MSHSGAYILQFLRNHGVQNFPGGEVGSIAIPKYIIILYKIKSISLHDANY